MTGPNNKMRRLALIGGVAAAVFCGVAATAMAGDEFVAWKRQLGTDRSNLAYSVATDADGNVYLAGTTDGSLHGANKGRYDAWVAKYATDGQLLWKRQLGSADKDVALGVATDADGNVYLTGWTLGSLGGPNKGTYDAWVAKYAADGRLLWKRQLGTDHRDYANGVATDTDGNVYLTGSTIGSLGGPKNGSVYQFDAWVAKFAPSGQLLWTQQLGTDQNDEASGVATNADGSVYVTGWTNGSLSGLNNGRWDAWVAKYATNGQHLWTQQLGTDQDDQAFGVATDVAGNVFLTGWTKGSLGRTPLSYRDDAWVAKYDANGHLVWTQQLGSALRDRATGVATDANGNVYLSGYTSGLLGATTRAGPFDAWVAKYDAEGNRLWKRQPSSHGYDKATGVATDAAGNLYVAGWTTGELGSPKHGDHFFLDAWVLKFSEASSPVD